MKIRFSVSGSSFPAIQAWGGRKLSETRKQLVVQVAKSALQKTIEANPVETGRSRAAWGMALRQLSEYQETDSTSSPADRLDPTAPDGTLFVDHQRDKTRIEATNHVEYVAYLEYGTSRMAPLGMVRKGLAFAKRLLPAWFQWR